MKRSNFRGRKQLAAALFSPSFGHEPCPPGCPSPSAGPPNSRSAIREQWSTHKHTQGGTRAQGTSFNIGGLTTSFWREREKTRKIITRVQHHDRQSQTHNIDRFPAPWLMYNYLALEDVDFAVADVQVVAHLVQLGRESVAFLGRLQGNLRLFLDETVLFFKSLPQFFHLFYT